MPEAEEEHESDLARKSLEDIAKESLERKEAFKMEKARLKAQTEAFTQARQ